MSDETGFDLDGRLMELGIDKNQAQEFKNRLGKREGGPVSIAFMGQSGVGKSSLCNAIFGKDVAHVSNVNEGTEKGEHYDVSLDNDSSIRLIDLPGIGHNTGRDGIYRKMYRDVLPRCDLVLWLFKADSRANASDQNVFGADILPNMKSGLPVIPVIAQSDKIDPSFEWNNEAFKHGPEQEKSLEEKRVAVAKIVKRKSGDVAVVAVQALEDQMRMFGVKDLVYQIIHELPSHRRHNAFRHVNKRAASKRAKKTAEKGFLDTCWEVAKEVFGELGPVIIGKAFEAFSRWAKKPR